MKKQSFVTTLLVIVALIAGYAYFQSMQTTSPGVQQQIDADGIFDANHDAEMDRKAQESEAVSGVSKTTELLMPGDELDIVTQEVTYYDGVEGFLAYPQEMPNAPGVILIHEWRGLNDHIKDMARVVAANGYTALAVDLFSGKVATSADEARELTSSVEPEEATANLLAAENFLRNKQLSPKVASLGWCFGGAQSLNLSLASETLDATVIYYGRLQTDPDQLQAVNSPVLGIFAEEDSGIPPEVVNEFQAALNQIGKQNDITIYSGVDHAFANPTGGNFSQEETMDAWNKTLTFLEETLYSEEGESSN